MTSTLNSYIQSSGLLVDTVFNTLQESRPDKVDLRMAQVKSGWTMWHALAGKTDSLIVLLTHLEFTTVTIVKMLV